MIRVQIDVHRRGNPDDTTRLGTLEITNVGGDEVADYHVAYTTADGVRTTSVVFGHRRSEGAERLVALALDSVTERPR